MKRFVRTVVAAAVAIVMGAGAAWAGSLNPTNAPGPTMHTLEEIYQQILSAQQQILTNQQALADMQLRLVAAGGAMRTAADMALIPAGSFLMGNSTNVFPSSEGFASEMPQHALTIGAFYIDRYEVTKAKWDTVYQWATNHGYGFSNAGSARGTNHPVQTVSWYDCLKWCNARSAMEGFPVCYTNTDGTAYTNGTLAGDCNWSATGYRLPTEAEWEKASRGGLANTRFPWGDANSIQHARANYNASPATFAYDTSPTTGLHPSYNSGSPPTSPVGSFAPNGYGLYDMAGNVWEWCWDWNGATYYASSPGTDPKGPTSGSSRCLRGGSASDSARNQRCSQRNGGAPTVAFDGLGFRCARTP